MKYKELVLTQGDSYRMRVILRSSAGFPVDITNAEFSAGIYGANSGAVASLRVEKVDPIGGVFIVDITSEESAALPATTTASTLSWGIKVNLNGSTTTLVKGQCNIREGFPL